MRKMNKVICILLVACFTIMVPMKASANVEIVTEASLNAAIEVIRAQHENAEITVEDGVIHVYVGEETNGTGIALLAAENKIYAPDGGTWGNFQPPWYTYIDSSAIIPYSVVFLSHEATEIMYEALTKPELLDFLLNHPITTATVETLIAAVLAKFNIVLTTAAAIFIISGSFKYTYDYINEKSFLNAVDIGNSSCKVRIDYTTIGGWPVNYYAAWSGNYVTDSPYQDFEPTFYKGVYSLADT